MSSQNPSDKDALFARLPLEDDTMEQLRKEVEQWKGMYSVALNRSMKQVEIISELKKLFTLVHLDLGKHADVINERVEEIENA